METAISDLVKRFEAGTLSRRQLIRGLTMLAAGAAFPAYAQDTPFTSTRIDHISVQVTDLPRSRAGSKCQDPNDRRGPGAGLPQPAKRAW